jgi:hypothetical protein
MKEDRELEEGTEDLDEKDVVENEHNEDIKNRTAHKENYSNWYGRMWTM